MPKTAAAPEQNLKDISGGDAPVLEAVLKMHLDTADLCSLDAHDYHLARLAALVAMDAPPASYLTYMATAQDSGVTIEDAQGVLVAVAPITGGPHITSAAGNILRAFEMASTMAGSGGGKAK